MLESQSLHHNNPKPELLLFCRVSPTFNTTKELESSLKRTLQASIDSFEFWRASLVLIREGRNPVWWYASKEGADTEENNDVKRWLKLCNSLSGENKSSGQKMLDNLSPVISTTIPVILKAGDPVGTMEIGIFNTDHESAKYMLVKAVSLGRHMADIIQESLFQRQKDHYLRKMAVWLEMVNTISSTLDIRQVLHVVAQLAADLFSAKTCIYLLDENDQTLIPAVAVGSYDPELKKKFKALKGTRPFPAITRVIKTQEAVVVTPENMYQLLTPEIINDFAYGWMVLVPILSKGETIGVMQVDRPWETGGFDQEETEIIFAIARATAIAIENARLIEALEQKEELLHQLVNKIITAQEDERKRLASDLHDGIIQSLIAIWYRLQRISPDNEDINPEKWYEEISNLTSHLNHQIQEIRSILYDLRPIILDNYGLIPAIESYTSTLKENYSLPIELSIEGRNENLPSKVEITLFRILQEALTNVLKHAEATEVKVKLFLSSKEVTLVVEDNGTGLDFSLLSLPQYQKRLGLASIQERAHLLGGTCQISSQKGEGTSINVKIPL